MFGTKGHDLESSPLVFLGIELEIQIVGFDTQRFWVRNRTAAEFPCEARQEIDPFRTQNVD
jgi:hypothetical protein